MGRPEKRNQLTPYLGRKFASYFRAYEKEFPDDQFPDDKELLRDIIRALLRRLSHVGAKARVSRHAYHKIQMLMVAEESWGDRPSSMQATSPQMDAFERGAYYGELLCGIADRGPSDTKPSKDDHWKPAFSMQREILEVYLRGEEFPERDALALRVSWLTQHGRELDARLKSIPCYCGYGAAFSLAQISEKNLKRSERMGGFVSKVLARLHGIPKGTAIKDSKTKEPDGIPIWSPVLRSHLPLLEIESRIDPPFPPFQSPQQKPNF